MDNRIKEVMAKEGYTPSTFADKIDVKRATITHILSGRNNPSLDVVKKILETFPAINSEWLLFGKQPIYRNKKVRIEPDLFAENPINPVNNPTPIPEKIKEIKVKPVESIPEGTMNQEIKPQNLIPVYSAKKIDKIMILYSDRTFENFSPD
jgi:DNA-binding XRE family transcriptional regulator